MKYTKKDEANDKAMAIATLRMHDADYDILFAILESCKTDDDFVDTATLASFCSLTRQTIYTKTARLAKIGLIDVKWDFPQRKKCYRIKPRFIRNFRDIARMVKDSEEESCKSFIE